MQNAQKKAFNARLLQNVYTYDIEDKRLQKFNIITPYTIH